MTNPQLEDFISNKIPYAQNISQERKRNIEDKPASRRENKTQIIKNSHKHNSGNAQSNEISPKRSTSMKQEPKASAYTKPIKKRWKRIQLNHPKLTNYTKAIIIGIAAELGANSIETFLHILINIKY